MKKKILVLTGALALTMVTPAFANPTHSFCVGAELVPIGSPVLNTVQETIDVAYNLGLAGYSPTLVVSRESDPTIKINDTSINYNDLNSGAIYLAGHGSTNGKRLAWENNNTGLNYCVVNNEYYAAGHGRNIANAKFDDCKLAIIASCYGGLSGGLANQIQINGADCTFGWTDSVWDVTMALYTKKLSYELAQGSTIQQAIKAANAYMQSEEVSKKYNIDERVYKKYKTYGSGVYNPIKINRSAVVIDNMDSDIVVDDNDPLIYNPDTYTDIFDTYTKVESARDGYKSRGQENIEAYIAQNIDPRFSADAFEKTEIETIPGDHSDMLITYRYKVGDVVSDFGYNVNIENGKMVSYKEVGTDIYGYTLPEPMATDAIKDEKLKKYNKKLTAEENTIIEQNVKVTFDSKEKVCKYSVSSVFETENGSIYSTGEYCE